MNLSDYEAEHAAKLREALAECMVLLRRNDDFPLGEAGKIAAYGSGVRHTIKGGTGSGEVNSRYFVNVEEGLKTAGFQITSGAWLDAYDKRYEATKDAFIKYVRRQAKQAHQNVITFSMGAIMPEPEYEFPLDAEGDVAIYVLSRISGEGRDRAGVKGDSLLTDTERRDILALNKKYARFMLILNVGGVVDLSGLNEVSNILLMSQLGVETGNALADVLLGKANPSGKLATTWADWGEYCAVGDFGEKDDTRYKEGIYVGYRYFDSVGKRARFPFGYGDSYTTFDRKVISCSQRVNICNEHIAQEEKAAALQNSLQALCLEAALQVEVTNTGAYAGKEVVQVYVSLPEGELDQPYQVLAGFAKTRNLQPGEKETLPIYVNLKEVAPYHTKLAAYVLETGEYIIRVGNSSVNTQRVLSMHLADNLIVRQVRNSLGTPDFVDYNPKAERKEVSADAIEKQEEKQEESQIENQIDTSAQRGFRPYDETEVVTYKEDLYVDSRIKELTDDELIYMNIGAFGDGGLVASVVGNAAFSVAGAAGQTTLRLKEKGIGSLVMADGPAGVRVAKDYFVDGKGIHAVGDVLPASMMMFAGGPLKWFFNALSFFVNRPKGDVQHHYATAIPIGTAIAQSFNVDLAKMCGDIVGDEMERIGVHLWLAPAMNIHRDIRCGRNFEYFSEDPLISGEMAAAITLGVQSHKGRGVTIKHFAANNQETCRYTNNSLVSERAMREIYLKGYEICVRKAKPKAVMTSYNLLNGEHTSERHDLIEDVLRSEYGFEGMVMTDWVISGFASRDAKHPGAVASRVLLSGNDLFMPGGRGDFDNVKEALSQGKITREVLQRNASRVLKLVDELCESIEE